MKSLIIIAIAFIVPLLTIAVFIFVDQSLTRLAKYLKTKFAKRKPVNPECKKCAGCKLATTGGCAGRKKKDKKADV